ncbi:hypothetical protein ACHAXS_014056 [Conticribra weissflogii]
MSFRTKTRLRRPCFDPTRAAATGGTAAVDPLAIVNDASTLANFTRLRRKHLSRLDGRVGDDDAENDADDVSSQANGGGDAHGTRGKDNIGSNGNNEVGDSNKEPSLKQCIALLEPHLAAFRLTCDAREREQRREKRLVGNDKVKSKKKSKPNKNQTDDCEPDESDDIESRNSMIHELIKENIENGYREKHNFRKLKEKSDDKCAHDDEENHERTKNNNRKMVDDDEVPQQIVRMARFFPWRWLPIKKALLRPPPSAFPPLAVNSKEKNTNSKFEMKSAEVGLAYRLRLARATYKKGMLGRAEYESLLGACRQTFQCLGKRKMGIGDESEDGEYENVDETVRNSKRMHSSHSESYLKERIRLALMRLPTDAALPENSMSAWNYVKEVLSECERHWEKITMHQGNEAEKQHKQISQQRNEPTANRQSHSGNGNMRSIPLSEGDSSVTPDEVAEWALTSWTALLISQGLDSTRPMNDPIHHEGFRNSAIINNSSDSIGGKTSKIEKQYAFLLSNWSSDSSKPKGFERSRHSRLRHAFLTNAINYRIDELLSPSNIEALNGIHILSLGRLFCQFARREEAERHILQSIIRCSFAGGLVGVSQLSRILAVYVCGISSSTEFLPVEENSYDHDNNNPASPPNVSGLEHDLKSRLDDSEMVMNVVMNHCKEENTEDAINPRRSQETSLKKQQEEETRIVIQAQSYLEVVLHGAAHLVRFATTNSKR